MFGLGGDVVRPTRESRRCRNLPYRRVVCNQNQRPQPHMDSRETIPRLREFNGPAVPAAVLANGRRLERLAPYRPRGPHQNRSAGFQPAMPTFLSASPGAKLTKTAGHSNFDVYLPHPVQPAPSPSPNSLVFLVVYVLDGTVQCPKSHSGTMDEITKPATLSS